MLIAVLAMLAVVLSSCKDDDPTVGIDSGMPAPFDFVYDEMGSSNTAISVSWNAEQAIAAGATSFTVQLIKSVDAVGDVYDNDIKKGGMSTTIDASANPHDLCTFNGLKAGRIYYVRVRANYPRSVYSDWVLASAAGAPARIKVGKGIVPESEGPDAALMVRMGTISESTAIVEWSTTSFADNDADKKNAYTLEIFEDAALSKLNVKWTYGANNSIWAGGTKFILTGLTPGTKYWARVTDTTNDEVAETLEFQTNASQAKAIPATAAAGDIILYEDFRDLLWGGDLFYSAAGYSATARSSATEFWKATGSDPLNSVPEAGFYLVDRSVEMGMFNTVGKALPATSLKDWGLMAEDNTAGAICARPGQVKMGASSKCAWICTPELSCLTKPATIELTFKAALYGTDPGQAIIEVLDKTTKAANFFITYEDRFVAEEFSVESPWKEYKFTISNVTNTSRIAIGGNRKGVAGQHRFYLDDIQIKVISYGELTAPDAPAKPELTPTDKTIIVTWDKVSRADGYTVEYKKTADANWTVAIAKTAETTYTIEGLDFETAYDVRVKALTGDLASEPSEVAQTTTLAEIKKLGTPEVTAAPGLGWVNLKFAPVLNATDYEVYSGETKIDSKIMSEAGAETVIVCAYGMSLNAPYTLKVRAIADGIESSDFSAEVSGTTGKIQQLTKNVGPTHVSVNWDDVSGYDYSKEGLEVNEIINGTTLKNYTAAAKRGYYIELADNQDMANPIYSCYCLDGQASANGSFGGSSWYGKTNSKNLVPPTSVTLGQLNPNTTYYFRVKAVAGYTFSAFSGTVVLDSPNGASEFSPAVALQTEAKHTAGTNEILFQGFDDITMQCDFINTAAGLTPYVGTAGADKAAITNPHMGNWCAYPFATSHLLSTWGFVETANYIDGQAKHNTWTNRVGTAKSGSLEGWYIGDQVSPHQGYVKIGTSSNSNYYLATPALNSPLLDAGGTNCTFSFKGCPLMTDPLTVDIEVYRAATQTFETVQSITMDSALNAGWTTTDYVAEYKWTTYSVDITLHPGDNVAIVPTNKNRIAVDDILIVTK